MLVSFLRKLNCNAVDAKKGPGQGRQQLGPPEADANQKTLQGLIGEAKCSTPPRQFCRVERLAVYINAGIHYNWAKRIN